MRRVGGNNNRQPTEKDSRGAATAYSPWRQPGVHGTSPPKAAERRQRTETARPLSPLRATPLRIFDRKSRPFQSSRVRQNAGRAFQDTRVLANVATKVLNGVALRGFYILLNLFPLACARGYTLSPLRG
jgi:hypothetical protein